MKDFKKPNIFQRMYGRYKLGCKTSRHLVSYDVSKFLHGYMESFNLTTRISNADSIVRHPMSTMKGMLKFSGEKYCLYIDNDYNDNHINWLRSGYLYEISTGVVRLKWALEVPDSYTMYRFYKFLSAVAPNVVK